MNTETIFRLTTFSTLLIGAGISIYFRIKADPKLAKLSPAA